MDNLKLCKLSDSCTVNLVLVITNSVSSSIEGTYDTEFRFRMMVGAEIQIQLCMCWFSVDISR